MSAAAIALALTVFFGGPNEEVEYALFPDNAFWYLLDDSGIEQSEQLLDTLNASSGNGGA